MIRIKVHAILGTADVSFPYDPQLVELVKSIPGKRYDPATKVWTIPSDEVNFLIGLAEHHGHRVIRSDPGSEQSPSTRKQPAAMWADQLFAALRPDLAEAVFRALTKVLHPDAGGDTVAMQQLNAARDRLAVRR